MTPVGFLETNVIYCDDNLHRLSQFPAECIDLIYLDPPFFSNRNYEVIWGDEADSETFEIRSRTKSATDGQTIALVARLTQTVDMSKRICGSVST